MSVARQWNEILLESIRGDFARPTVHARNLFHVSAAMYDCYAAIDEVATPYLLGTTLNEVSSSFMGFPLDNVSDPEATLEEAISYAAYRLLSHRFRFSPSSDELLEAYDEKMQELGYDPNVTSLDYSSGTGAALGNFVASEYIAYGLVDGSQEEFDYANAFYAPVNPSLNPEEPGNRDIANLNRWQPLEFDEFIDQSGNPIADAIPFLSPEWGEVFPFAMGEEERQIKERDGFNWKVYEDPGEPPYFSEETNNGENAFKWGFQLVSIWGSHLDPSDNVMWDISPASIGNMPNFPNGFDEYPEMYNEFLGGDRSPGRTLNPITNEPYPANMVPRGDYARVLAEFWADGPDSETPPGHWFVIMNKVMDHPLFQRRFEGQGDLLTDLEFDIKAYFVMGGTMHDAAISAWSSKGYYDYIRPISAIRALAQLGQASDPNLPNYQDNGIVLKEGYIELVLEGDPLLGVDNEHFGKVKLFTWKGPSYIDDPDTDMAGVGWILAENWWPYQRPTFVTPPFAGYVSGHSTFSRAAAEILTLLTGDEYFPGGVGEFEAPRNNFLVFEEGPSVDVTLQWATYRDASDQTSLSRIWGGIHPPADDIPGRRMGIAIAERAFEFAKGYFEGIEVTSISNELIDVELQFGPNPVKRGDSFVLKIGGLVAEQVAVSDIKGNLLGQYSPEDQSSISIETNQLSKGMYFIRLIGPDWQKSIKFLVVE
jgi:hypothetical protein